MEYIGIFNHKGSTIDITDPCYKKNTWCRIEVPLPEGEYECYIEIDDTGDWGHRIGETMIKNPNRAICHTECVRSIGVDAGLAGYFDNKPDYVDDEWRKFCDMLRNDDYWIVNENTPAKCNGFFTSSGFGDGEYNVYTLYDEDYKIIGYSIIFIED